MRGEALIDYLHNDKVRKFAFKTEFFKGKNIEFASDFDVFCAICNSISLFAGHYIRDSLLFALERSLNEKIEPFLLYSNEYKKYIWQRIFYEDSMLYYQAQKKTFFEIDTSSAVLNEETVNIIDLVDLTCETAFYALDTVFSKLKNTEARIITFDIRGLKYARPDDFHAGENYKNLIQNGDGDVFLLWLLCRIFMNFDLELRLVADKAIDAQRILDLLASVKLSPKTYIRFDVLEESEYERLEETVLDFYKKNISLELYISKEIDKDTFCVKLKKLISIIPLACINIPQEQAERVCEALDTVLEGTLDLREKNTLLSCLRRAR